MLEESSVLIGLEVFTPWGVRIGAISDLELDSEEEEITNVYLEETNDRLVENGANLMIPFRWIQGLGDIVILNTCTVRESAEEILKAADSSKALTDQLLAFGREGSLRPERVVLADVVEEISGALPSPDT